jgi:hypothetical protein
MSPFVSENIYQSLTPFLEAIFNFTMAWSLLSTCLTIYSKDVSWVANVWLSVMNVDSVDFAGLLVCKTVSIWKIPSKYLLFLIKLY